MEKAAGGSKVDLVDRLDIGSESGESSRNLEEWDSPVTGDFEIPFATIEWGTHIGKGLCSETKEGTLPELAMPLAVRSPALTPPLFSSATSVSDPSVR